MKRQNVPDTSRGTQKTRSPTVDNPVWQTGCDDVDADRRRDLIPRSAGWSCNLSVRYDGAAREGIYTRGQQA